MSNDVVIVSADAVVVDDVLRLTAAAGRTATVVESLVAAARVWASAGVVVVGSDVATTPMPTRERVIVVTHESVPSADTWRAAHTLRAEHVAVLPAAESWLLERLDAADETGQGFVIGVVGARGGAGATTVAVALACATARSRRSVVLIDADPLGGGIDLAIASEGVAGATWADFADRSGRLPAATLTSALPQRHGVHVLTHQRSRAAGTTSTSAAIVLDAARRAFDVVVIDIARTPDAVARVGWSVADLALVVTPRDVRSLAAASAVLAVLPGGLPLHLVTRGPAPGGLGAHDAARILGPSVAIDWPYDKTLPGSFERGIAPGSAARSVHARAAAQLLADVLAPSQVAA